MNRYKKLIAMVIVILVFAGTIAGCAKKGTTAIPPIETAEIRVDYAVLIDLSLEMVPLTESPAIATSLTPSAPGTLTKTNSKAIIDYSNSADGYVMIKYKNSTTKELRVLITGPSEVQYQYQLKKNGDYDVYPFSDGNGKYQIGVYEQVEGTKYSTAISGEIEVKLNDEFAPFLRPNQFVNFNDDSEAVKIAADLVKDTENVSEKITAIYNYVVENISYDKELARTVQSGYLPDVDKVLEKKKGICFDYAAVMAAMLRSQGVPTKLVIGYAGTQYHAWIDVYSEETGWVNAVIFFDGETWKRMDPTFESSGRGSASAREYIGNGENYSARYLY
jgi:predicted small lipoprotein YifL